MEFAIVLLSVIVMPLLMGYFRGYGSVDPNTPEGKIYYVKGEETNV